MCKLCKNKGFIITDILQGVSIVCSCRVKPKVVDHPTPMAPTAPISPAVLVCFAVGDKIKVIVDRSNHQTSLNTDPKKRYSGHGAVLGDLFTIKKLGMSSLEPDLVKIEIKEKSAFLYGHEIEKV